MQLAQDLLIKKLGDLAPATETTIQANFNSFAQHFDQPLDNSKMEALTTLAEMSTGRKKVSAAAASAMGA
jgi:uncharacterized protein YeaO (DUF488 family)